MKLIHRALGVLPTGTLPVAAGLAVLGAGSYAHLAFADHTLGATGKADVSELWTVVYLIGLGIFFPVEQELIRLVAARKAAGDGIAPVVRRGCALAGGIFLATLIPLAAAGRVMTDRLFDGDAGMLAALAGGFAALAVISVSRGVLAGMGRFPGYGSQLAIDGGLRIAFAAALGAAGVRSAVAFGLILTAAPLLSAVLTLPPLLRDLRPGPPVAWAQLCRGLGLLIGTMVLAQLVANIAVINVKLLSPGHPAVVAALLAAVVLARVPLFVFASLQASLLPGLADAIAVGELTRFRQLMIRGSGIVTALGLAGGIPAVIVGPLLVRVLFAARPVLGWTDFALLASGTLCYMLAMVLGQGAMALSRHREQLLAWVAGTVVLGVVTFLPGEIKLRVEAAYALSSLTVAGALALMLWHQRSGSRGTPAVADGPAVPAGRG